MKLISKMVVIAFVSYQMFAILPTYAEAPSVIEVIKVTPKMELELGLVTWKNKVDPLFEKIGKCESGHDIKAQNPYSSASGEYQWLVSSWKHYAPKLWGESWKEKNILSTDNRELAWFVYTHYGTKDWEADIKSYNCWKGEIPNGIYKDIL